MALPAAAVAASRAAKIGGMLSGGGGEKEKPGITSAEGIIMMLFSGLIAIANIILAVLDLALGLGTAIAPFVNGVATVFIGGWIFKQTGKLPIKKALLPFGANCLPLVRFISCFFWPWSVWSCLKK